MKEIFIELQERSYNIFIKEGLIKNSAELLSRYVSGKKCFLISDTNVFELYGNNTISMLRKASAVDIVAFKFTPGEQSKNIKTLSNIYEAMADAGMSRDSVIIALGGGVVGDISGFAAATYMRGIDFIQIPTSLLAMVDSSVGGKTGIDLKAGKNLAGAFWQPKVVIIDPEVLQTLPMRELKTGMAEVIKYGIIYDKPFFSFLEKEIKRIISLDLSVFTEIISTCCKIKAKVVIEDERENGIRAILNFGHTFGHAIEAVTKYKIYTHGEAVAIGMLMAAKTAAMLNLISSNELKKISELIESTGLHSKAEGIKAEEVYQAMFKDKKVKNGKINFVIPESIGTVIIKPIDQERLLKSAIADYIV